jgi:hypothetical protein
MTIAASNTNATRSARLGAMPTHNRGDARNTRVRNVISDIDDFLVREPALARRTRPVVQAPINALDAPNFDCRRLA